MVIHKSWFSGYDILVTLKMQHFIFLCVIWKCPFYFHFFDHSTGIVCQFDREEIMMAWIRAQQPSAP